jgi:hypothetical protein
MKWSTGARNAIAILILAAGPAAAQDISWAAGTWKGRMEGYRGQDPSRVMSINIDKGIARCTWGEGFRPNPPAAKACAVSATGLKLTTGENNQVDLRRSGDTLSGTFTSTGSSGKTYSLTMKKE